MRHASMPLECTTIDRQGDHSITGPMECRNKETLTGVAGDKEIIRSLRLVQVLKYHRKTHRKLGVDWVPSKRHVLVTQNRPFMQSATFTQAMRLDEYDKLNQYGKLKKQRIQRLDLTRPSNWYSTALRVVPTSQ